MRNHAEIRRAIAAMRQVADQLEKALQESSVVRSATVEEAKKFVLATVRERPQQLSTSALRRLARGRRLSNEALSRAIDTLHREGILSFTPGARGSRGDLPNSR